ncbi:MAG: phosphate starvation-inducible protein PhoH [Deltaproteobacteria bacterium RBG_19FT_COMBO_60_16]|nr:MAG: phosphate starvation-inducible protein PhoH [Deltaproteobacteria bacterium RBG_16_64_85]OGP99667.1 MAG: phosphate starvation-inducible protein PhoH [Deltaproteobacteria bacterium RBG_19FT_COMBO_60_16]
MEAVEKREEVIRFDDSSVLSELFGSHDDQLKIVERALGVSVHPKGNEATVAGDPLQVELAVKVLGGLYRVLRKGIPITSNDVIAAVRIVCSDRNADVFTVFQDVVFKSSRNKIITPKSVAQKRYLDAMRDYDIVFGVGPAGTGKTFLAMAMAVGFLLRKEVKRIILARPAVEAGEKLGFLPGDMAEKVNPYLRPLHDALYTMLEYEQAAKLMERGTIEVAPLAFMRGRTLNDSFVILDEAQNTTSEQMKMFLTRIGFGSKAVITGDITQTDLPSGRVSGLNEALSILDGVEGIRFSYFTEIDVVRHPIVQEIIKAYERYEKRG